jgi:hypothetical protein
MLNLQPIRERLGPPFLPFVINLSDGRRFVVPHPDFIAIGRGVVLLVDQEGVGHIIEALHIVSIDNADGASSPKPHAA